MSPFLPGGNFKFILIVGGVGHGFADVPLDAAGAQNRSGNAECDRVFRGKKPTSFVRPTQMRFSVSSVSYSSTCLREIVAEALHFLFEAVVGFVLQAADAEGVSGEPRAAIFLENFQNFFALAEAIKNWRQRADIKRMGAEPEQVAGDSLQLRQDRADHARPRRGFHAHQFFNRFAVAQAIRNRCDVIHAVHVGRELLVAAMLGDFFDAAVQVADDAFGADHASRRRASA